MILKPFWCYYGGKWRAATKYPVPCHSTIIEPFAGAAGYSMRYPTRKIILIEKYPVIAEMWRYLISVPSAEVRRIPTVDHIDDLPGWVPEGARYLVGFNLNNASTAPRNHLSSGLKKLREAGQKTQGWSEDMRERVARQVGEIRHWQIIEGDYKDAPNAEATWFIDPPYNNKAGSHYVHTDIDYDSLGKWCQSRPGQVLVCENKGADWLPFRHFRVLKSMNNKGSQEVIWTK